MPPRARARAGGLDLASIAESDADRALVLWSNSPSNPTGGLGDLAPKRHGGGPGACPSSPTSATPSSPGTVRPARCSRRGFDGVVAVHSLSKRSNLAGVRVGFFAGDPELVEFLRSVRRHAGLMVPGPAQAAGAVALADDDHVEVQRRRYRERLAFMAAVLADAGCPVELPEGGFYLWVPVPAARWADAWSMAEDLAAASRAPGQSGRSLRPRRAPASSGWPSSSPWSGWSWWPSAWLASPIRVSAHG